ncbi:MAG: hypothetical protein HQL01_12425 [Nitrospirae bacterium]|nr:hypothetical protein [Nitrospirota bacterium]
MAKRRINLQEAIATAIALYSNDEIEKPNAGIKQENNKTTEAMAAPPPCPNIIKEDAK